MSRKPSISVTSRGEGAKNRNAALARRLQGNPFASGSRPIPLKDSERWQTRWANSELNENRHFQMKADLGWEPVTAADLPNGVTPDGIGLSVAPDGQLCRGVRGTERLYKMDKEDFAAVQERKTQANLKGIGSASKIKADMADAAAASHGSEAAEFINSMPGQVIDKITGGEAA